MLDCLHCPSEMSRGFTSSSDETTLRIFVNWCLENIAFIVQCYQHRLDMLERSYSGACEERLLGIFEQDVVFEEEESLDLNRKYIEQEIQRR